jgi:hypothetical protein
MIKERILNPDPLDPVIYKISTGTRILIKMSNTDTDSDPE